VYLKIGYLLPFCLSLFVGFFIDRLGGSQKVKRVVIGVFVGSLLITSYPFFTGEILRDHTETFPGYAVTIPKDYYQIAEVINKGRSDAKTFIFPVPEGYNYHLAWENGGYVGSDFFRFLVDSPVYYVGSFPRMREFSESYDLQILKELGVKYVLYRKDIREGTLEDYLIGDKESFTQNVLDDPDVTEVLDTQNVSLYQIEEGKYLPLIHISGKAYDFETLGFSEYKVLDVQGQKDSTLVFSETFSGFWKATLHTNGEVIDLSPWHTSIYKYANAWQLPVDVGEPGAYVEIEYIGQRYFDVGLAFTMVTVFGVALLLLKEYIYVSD